MKKQNKKISSDVLRKKVVVASFFSKFIVWIIGSEWIIQLLRFCII